MKIFVTVGTTPFESLIKYIDTNIKNHELIAQISTGKYIPKKMESFDYKENIENYYKWADLIITHAGAGSVYKLLEMGKRIVVIPNIERLDNHQLELANFIEKNNYGEVFYKLEDIKINDNVKRNKYVKENFFKINEILEILIGD
ncbi:MAG: PssE/Cps14G family polysaccharide biosynthesis glycosyltransferase [Cetobacterium sp.]